MKQRKTGFKATVKHIFLFAAVICGIFSAVFDADEISEEGKFYSNAAICLKNAAHHSSSQQKKSESSSLAPCQNRTTKSFLAASVPSAVKITLLNASSSFCKKQTYKKSGFRKVLFIDGTNRSLSILTTLKKVFLTGKTSTVSQNKYLNTTLYLQTLI